jgi:hypothetical protein
MNTTFKSNSRFACLIDDIPENKKNKKYEGKINEAKAKVEVEAKPELDKFNSFKSERTTDYFKSNRRDDSYKEREYQEREEKLKAKREFEEKQKKKKIEESLHIDNFPELITNKKSLVIDKTSSTNFVELFKNNTEMNIKINNNLDPDLNDLKPGNILIKMDPVTRKIITKIHPNDKDKEIVKSEKEVAYEIMDNLVKLHEKRTKEYIELYGYDTWEKMFKFPNWEEENYFDSDDDNDDNNDNNDNDLDYELDDESRY